MNEAQFISFQKNKSTYRFLKTGDIFSFSDSGILINQLRGNPKDGSLNNLYLRIYKNDSLRIFPLLGTNSKSRISCSPCALRQSGEIDGIAYSVTFVPQDSRWFWYVQLTGNGEKVDLVYGQDLGISSEGAVFSNELYVSQYLGHTVFSDERGYVICSRQNMPVDSRTPYIQQGVIGTTAIHYSTDAMQFYGLSCKETGFPEALYADLPDVNLQYESAYTALQTPVFTLNQKKTEFAFYGIFVSDHPEVVTSVEYQDTLLNAYEALSFQDISFTELPSISHSNAFGAPYASPSFTSQELSALYPSQLLVEEADHQVYSFFTPSHAHVVTKEKELKTLRPHGTIIITPPDTQNVNSNLIASTHYMNGIFNSHVVIGNTDAHKLISSPRNTLNLLKNSGQRLYVRWDGTYHLLTLPGIYEMGMNYSRWYYKILDDTLVITSYCAAENPDVILEINSTAGKRYDFILTNQLTYGAQEYTHELCFTRTEDSLVFPLDTPQYPGLHYKMQFSDNSFELSDDRIFFQENTCFDPTFMTLSFRSLSTLKMVLQGYLSGEEPSRPDSYDFEAEKSKVYDYYDQFLRYFKLSCPQETEHIQILNETAWWYCHNALIHYSMPHGLEQPGGAAWGTRDICQGPIELFSATQHPELVRSILLNIFAHQDTRNGEWPQWFMFDGYDTTAGECHGDVIFWPLKCVADYLNDTEDFGILSEVIPYADQPQRHESLLEHVKLALSTIVNTRMIGDTGLITYAGGDWDDTLQPADEASKKYLVSSWTVALAYQTFAALAHALKPISQEMYDTLNILTNKIHCAFNDTLLKDDVIAGFLDCREGYRYMLHPSDNESGIHYRLLPLTRSIIAELADPQQAHKNQKIIDDHLMFPDGVRLMDHPAPYNGGNSVFFKRAEQAANVGREISLQYTHAHIRYIEAMAKLGSCEKAWNALFVINPILIRNSVPNAMLRQSNMYFSSSEGDFHDRYEYDAHFDKLKDGSIDVKGGWRLYSSGPGIYLKQLISNILGIRFCSDGITVDPVLPAFLDGLQFRFCCFDKMITFHYHFIEDQDGSVMDNGRLVPSDAVRNPYRKSGRFIHKQELQNCCGTLDLYIPKNQS